MVTRLPVAPFFGALPARGPWTAIGLTRAQFLGICLISIASFVVIGGPVWRHLHDPHLVRVFTSYAVIPPMALIALWRNDQLDATHAVAAIGVIGLIKLVATAGLLVVFSVLFSVVP